MGSALKKKHAQELAKGLAYIGNNYIFKEELSFDQLKTTYKDHRRLRVFAKKGCACVRCNKVGTRLIVGQSFTGSLHVDLYTDDLILMTIDHILPKSKGGNNDISNLDPMCGPCNWSKGSKIS